MSPISGVRYWPTASSDDVSAPTEDARSRAALVVEGVRVERNLLFRLPLSGPNRLRVMSWIASARESRPRHSNTLPFTFVAGPDVSSARERSYRTLRCGHGNGFDGGSSFVSDPMLSSRHRYGDSLQSTTTEFHSGFANGIRRCDRGHDSQTSRSFYRFSMGCGAAPVFRDAPFVWASMTPATPGRNRASSIHGIRGDLSSTDRSSAPAAIGTRRGTPCAR